MNFIHIFIHTHKNGFYDNHVGRHTMGGFIVDANIETRPAMAMLGLKSAKTLLTYEHLKQDKLKNEADKLGGVM